MATLTVNLTPTTAPAAGSSLTPHTTRMTVFDAIEHLQDFFGADPSEQGNRIFKRAIQGAMREIANAGNWTYYYQHGRLNVQAPYSTGTITGDVTGGAHENMVTLAGGTWPTWAHYGMLKVGDVLYPVDRRISTTIITLIGDLAPTTDIAAATTYKLYRDTYTLPEDFVAGGNGFHEVSWGGMEFVHPDVWLRSHRYSDATSNNSWMYTFMGDPKVPGRLAMRLFPQPDTTQTLDIAYKRRPRKVTLDEYKAGTVTVDSVNTPATVTGTNTTFTASMVGSVIRLYSDAVQYPTGWHGKYPAVVERNVRVFTSATAISVDDNINTSYTAVKYRISDPIDVEEGAMLDAFLRCAELQAGIMRRYDKLPILERNYQRALIEAREADSRSWSRKAVGRGGIWYQRLADMPAAADIS